VRERSARAGIAPASPARGPTASDDLVGRLSFRDARAEDTFVDLGPALGVGYTELVAANPGVDPWLPKQGTRLVVPARASCRAVRARESS
jgi:L,D-transpeptidase ErfK/SrfK